jgi:hypothetical protein
MSSFDCSSKRLRRVALGEQRVERSPAGVELRLEALAIDLKEEVVLCDGVPLADREVHDLSGNVRREVDLASRLDLSIAR